MMSSYVIMCTSGGGGGKSVMYVYVEECGREYPTLPVIFPSLCCVMRTLCYCKVCIVCVL